jgi:hypothetical protein
MGLEDSMMSQGSTANETRMPVRWVVMFTGSTATADYQPAASAAESPSLVKEVTDMCVAFHPHVDIRLFPKDGEALLFWKARATLDWIVTRVTTAPNPEGTRIALEYCSLVFSDEEFAKLGFNPFRARDFSLHDQVRQQFLNHRVEPLLFALPSDDIESGRGYTANGHGANGTNGVVSSPTSATPLSADSLSTPENFKALRDYCDSLSRGDAPRPPKTFATWWSSHGEPPAGYFEIILRAAVPKPLEIREGKAAIEALVAQTKESLPTAPADDANAVALAQNILKKSDELGVMFSTAASRVNTESADDFRARMDEASAHARGIAEDIGIYRKRLEPTLTTADGARMDELIGRYDLLYREMPKIRHPNPFAVKSSDTTVSKRVTPPKSNATSVSNVGATKPTKGGQSAFNPMYVMVALVLAGVVFGAWKVFGGKTPETKPTPRASAKPGNGGKTGGAITPAADPVKAILLKYENSITEMAKRAAGDAAKKEAASDGEALSNSTAQKIAADAIKAAYKDKLPEDDYKKVFGSQDWDYSKLEKVLTNAMSAVMYEIKIKEGAGRGQYITDTDRRKAQEAERERQEEERQRREREQQAASSSDRERERERDRERERRERERERERERNKATPRPKSTPKPSSSGSSGAGSAGSTGL